MKPRIKLKSLSANIYALCLLGLLSYGAIAGGNTRSDLPVASAAEVRMKSKHLPYLTKAYMNPAPVDLDDGIKVGRLGKGKVNKAEVLKFAQEIAEGQHGLYDSLLIRHKGKLVFESYYRRGRINLHSEVASAAKVLTSLVVGRAVQMGYLSMDDLHKPLVGFLKDLDPSKFVEGAEKITLHKALTMRGGLGFTEEQRKLLGKPSAKFEGQGFVQSLLEMSAPITEESQAYLYGNQNLALVMQVINAVVPGGAEHFIRNEILNKLGITNYRWQTAPSGLPHGGYRVGMRPRDLVKWGALVVDDGKWKGEQLISQTYLKKATSYITKPTTEWLPPNYRYGYYFYETDVQVGKTTYDVDFAWGGGGRYIITVKELELSIVITAHDPNDKFMAQVSRRLIPAFVE